MQNKNPTKAEKTLAKIAKLLGHIERTVKEIKQTWTKGK